MPRPLPEEERALRPGVYRSEEFKPSVSFRIGKGWKSADVEGSDTLFITRGETVNLVHDQETFWSMDRGAL
jgi:hypothetical protein